MPGCFLRFFTGFFGGSGLTVVAAALMQLVVSGIVGGKIAGIVTCSSNGLLDLRVAGLIGIVSYGELFGVLVPIGGSGTGIFGCFFDGLLTHTTFAPYFERVFYHLFLLGVGGDGSK